MIKKRDRGNAPLAVYRLRRHRGLMFVRSCCAGKLFGRGPRRLPDWLFWKRLCSGGLPRPTW
jgi:hypothetical protein